MTYKELYEYSQTQITGRVGRKPFITFYELKEWVERNVVWVECINVYPVEDCQDGDPLGHCEVHGTQESRWEDADSWVVLITYNNNDEILNTCKKRFVLTKELMHVFDDEASSTDNAADYIALLEDIETRPLFPGDAYKAELNATWMALLILCPKALRDRAKEEYASGAVTEYEIALRFRIPKATVKSLFSKGYDDAYEKFVLNT